METRPRNFVWFAIAVRFVARVAGVRFQGTAVEGKIVQAMAEMIADAVVRIAEAIRTMALLAGSVVTGTVMTAKAGFPIAQKSPMIGGVVQPFTGNIQGNAASLADRYQDSQCQIRNRW